MIRTQPCDSRQARTRLQDAKAQMTHAEMADNASPPEERKAAASAAVLAGIAAADAACCKALGLRSRSQDHRDAVELVEQIAPGGPVAAKQLQRLLNLKDEAHYGMEDIGGQKHSLAVERAKALIRFAEETLQR